MTEAVIVSGGNIQKDFALDFLRKNKNKDYYMIAADRGLEFFMETGLVPDAAVGDFDSLSPEGLAYLESLENTEICRLQPEKDDSDTQHTVNYAIEKGAEKILILGATGSRIDHLLANLELLLLGEKKGTEISLVDKNNYITLIKSGTVLQKAEQFGTYVSFFPLGGDVTGLTLTGFRYPLRRHCLKAEDCGLTVSNEITEDSAKVEFESGSLLMLMTRD